MYRKPSLQETSKSIERIKLLMGYNISKTLNENIKNILLEGPADEQNSSNNQEEKKPKNSKFSDEQLAQVFRGNYIKSPDGLFDTYVDANIEITQLFTDKSEMSSWTNGGFKNSDGSMWTNEKLREFLHVPSVAFFRDEDEQMMVAYFEQDSKNAKNNKLYNGWKFAGYKVYKQGGEGTKDVIYNKKGELRLFDPNKDAYDEAPPMVELIPPDKKNPLKKSQKIKYTIINKNPNRLLKIEKVTLVDPKGGDSNDWYVKNKKYGLRDNRNDTIIEVESFTKDNIKPNWQGYIVLDIDAGGFGYTESHEGYGTSGPNGEWIPEKDGPVEDSWTGIEFDFGLEITTSEGKIFTTFRGGETDRFESRMQQRVRMAGEQGMERINPKLRVKVPDNFSPFCYDKFLNELWEVIQDGSNNVCMNSGKGDVWEKYISYDQKLVDKYPFPFGAGREPTQACKKLIDSIVTKYYSKDFPTGVCPEQREIFEKQKTIIEDELRSLEKRGQVQVHGFEKNDWYYEFQEKELSPSEQKRYKELKKQLGQLYTEYGFDDRNEFERFWDGYGLWIQGGLALLSLVATFGGTSWAAIATFAELADIYMNAAVGTYYALKGKSKEAILGFFFAALPKIHKLYGKVGELFGDPSVAATKSLANKIAKIEFRSVQEMEAFGQALPAAERELFYNALKLKPGDFEEAFRLVEEDLTKMASSGAAKFAKGTAKFIVKGGTDLLLIHELEKFHDDIVKEINKFCKDCFKTIEQQEKSKTYLNSLSPNQIKTIEQYIQKISSSPKLNDSEKKRQIQEVLSGGESVFVNNMVLIASQGIGSADKTVMKEIDIKLNKVKEGDDEKIDFIYKNVKKRITTTEFLSYSKKGFPFGYYSYQGNNPKVYNILMDENLFEDYYDDNDNYFLKTKKYVK